MARPFRPHRPTGGIFRPEVELDSDQVLDLRTGQRPPQPMNDWERLLMGLRAIAQQYQPPARRVDLSRFDEPPVNRPDPIKLPAPTPLPPSRYEDKAFQPVRLRTPVRGGTSEPGKRTPRPKKVRAARHRPAFD